MTFPARPIHSPNHATRWATAASALAAILFLNATLSFENNWPTPLIKPDVRLAPEFVLLWVALLATGWGIWRSAYSARNALAQPGYGRLTSALAIVYLTLIAARYWDVTVPALFGRDVNLYWDGGQIPQLLASTVRAYPLWQVAVVAALSCAFIAALFWLVRASIRHLVGVIPVLLQSRAATRATLGITACLVALVVANLAQVQATWPYVSKPVIPTYAKQAAFLYTAISDSRVAQALPKSPPMDWDLAGLNGVDVKVLFLESYGAVTYDNPEVAAAIDVSRMKLQQVIAGQGKQVLSAMVTSPTFAGGSGLSHLAFLSGVDMTERSRYELMLTTNRDTMVRAFGRHGYRTIGLGLYPGVRPETSFYGFDYLYGINDMDYPGPDFGFWQVPDQFAIARLDQMHPDASTLPPRFIFFPTITTHAPFGPTPPYQPDWSVMSAPDPFAGTSAEAIAAQSINWQNMLPAYVSSTQYTFEWLTGYVQRPAHRNYLMVLIGDHQPLGSVAGKQASWQVPIHVISDNPRILGKLQRAGFSNGLTRPDGRLFRMDELNQLLMFAFSSDTRWRDSRLVRRSPGSANTE